MEIWIEEREFYPFMSATNAPSNWHRKYAVPVTITAEEWADYEAMNARFEEWQKKLEDLEAKAGTP